MSQCDTNKIIPEYQFWLYQQLGWLLHSLDLHTHPGSSHAFNFDIWCPLSLSFTSQKAFIRVCYVVCSTNGKIKIYTSIFTLFWSKAPIPIRWKWFLTRTSHLESSVCIVSTVLMVLFEFQSSQHTKKCRITHNSRWNVFNHN